MREGTIATIVVGAALALLGSALSALIVHYIKRLDRHEETRNKKWLDRLDRYDAARKADHDRLSKAWHDRLDRSDAAHKAVCDRLSKELKDRFDRSEAANEESNAELRAGLSRHNKKLDTHGEVLTALRVEVGKLNVQEGREVLEMLRGLVEASAKRKPSDDD